MPYGIVNADGITTSSGQTLGAGNATGFKNRIINGAMMIDQRNAGASVTPATGAYMVDRWCYFAPAASKFTAQQNAGSVTPPTGFINYLGMTVASAVTISAGDYYNIQQRIEGLNVADLAWGTVDAKTVTLSFWVRSSLTGTFGGAFVNSAANRSYPFTYTISSANTWTQISVTVAGDTTGTWLTTNGIGITIQFGLGVGSTYSGTAGAWASANYVSATGATSVVGTNGATFYITGVQLEVGSTASSFDVRDYGRELRLCQRYFEVQNIAQNYNAGFNTTYAFQSFNFNTTKRTAPTMAFASMVYYSGGSTASFTPNVSASTTSQYSVGANNFTSFNGIQGGIVSASAEL